MGIEVAIFLITSFVLSVILIVEYTEYRRYRKAAFALIAHGEGMKIMFNDIITQINQNSNTTGVLAQSINLTDQEVAFIKSVLQVHSEALQLESMGKAYQLQRTFQGVARNGEDPTREIQG